MKNDYTWDDVVKRWWSYFTKGPDEAHENWKWREFQKVGKIMRAEEQLPTMCLMQLIAWQD